MQALKLNKKGASSSLLRTWLRCRREFLDQLHKVLANRLYIKVFK